MLKIKRGEKSWSFFPIIYNILLTITIAIIVIPPIAWFYKIPLIILSAYLLFKLAFFNDWFRNKAIGLMSKSQQHIEEYKGKYHQL